MTPLGRWDGLRGRDEYLAQLVSLATQRTGAAAAAFVVASDSGVEILAATPSFQPTHNLATLQRAAVDRGHTHVFDSDQPGSQLALAGIRAGGAPVVYLRMTPVHDPGGRRIGVLSLLHTEPPSKALDHAAQADRLVQLIEYRTSLHRWSLDRSGAFHRGALAA